MDRVCWFRTRSACNRRLEELEILDEEFRRTHHSFDQTSNIWKVIGDRQFVLKGNDHRLANGYRAFAYRQANMYTKLADSTVENWRMAHLHSESVSVVETVL